MVLFFEIGYCGVLVGRFFGGGYNVWIYRFFFVRFRGYIVGGLLVMFGWLVLFLGWFEFFGGFV